MQERQVHMSTNLMTDGEISEECAKIHMLIKFQIISFFLGVDLHLDCGSLTVLWLLLNS